MRISNTVALALIPGSLAAPVQSAASQDLKENNGLPRPGLLGGYGLLGTGIGGPFGLLNTGLLRGGSWTYPRPPRPPRPDVYRRDAEGTQTAQVDASQDSEAYGYYSDPGLLGFSGLLGTGIGARPGLLGTGILRGDPGYPRRGGYYRPGVYRRDAEDTQTAQVDASQDSEAYGYYPDPGLLGYYGLLGTGIGSRYGLLGTGLLSGDSGYPRRGGYYRPGIYRRDAEGTQTAQVDTSQDSEAYGYYPGLLGYDGLLGTGIGGRYGLLGTGILRGDPGYPPRGGYYGGYYRPGVYRRDAEGTQTAQVDASQDSETYRYRDSETNSYISPGLLGNYGFLGTGLGAPWGLLGTGLLRGYGVYRRDAESTQTAQADASQDSETYRYRDSETSRYPNPGLLGNFGLLGTGIGGPYGLLNTGLLRGHWGYGGSRVYARDMSGAEGREQRPTE
ncbi:hypothetical protein HIM_06648 [Hirsutella minnesotensis 3608]|uniref:Uncharacterized protein n=1 Tax=Hirsutella minnesotensis 3608 TaxID=1043627 RepID=A0A0F7ZNL9_9HYPO|nr:hypothetical protein HIM_06648 [Hirsutella minnesotensis 3608]